MLHLDGKDLRQHTLLERRASLKALLGSDDQSRIQFSDEFDRDGDALFKACAERRLEGIVSKHVLAPYRSGRSKTWLKTKCFTQSTFVVIGTDRDRKPGALRALLAHKDSGGLSYAGVAFIALADDERTRFFAELERLATSWAAFKLSRLTDVKWCRPKLVVEKHLAGSKFSPPRHGEAAVVVMSLRSFPPPWSVEKIPGGLKVCDANGESLASPNSLNGAWGNLYAQSGKAAALVMSQVGRTLDNHQ